MIKMSEEEEILKIEEMKRGPDYLYIAENINEDIEADKIIEIIKDKSITLEYIPQIKVIFLWTSKELSEDEYKQLKEKYGFEKVE